MAAKIKSDVLQALADWNAGKPVRSLELGHSHRMKETTEPTAQPQVDFSKFIHRDQERTYAFCFTIIDAIANSKAYVADHSKDAQNPEHRPPETWEEFSDICDTLELEFGELTPEERDGAESLAWKVLRVGWAKAIAGHQPHDYIEVTNPAAVNAT
jgi:hypothetical protein